MYNEINIVLNICIIKTKNKYRLNEGNNVEDWHFLSKILIYIKSASQEYYLMYIIILCFEPQC